MAVNAPKKTDQETPDSTTSWNGVPDEVTGRIEPFEASVNAVAVRVRGLWLGYLTLSTYLVIAVGSVTHRQLFFETPIKLPILNVDLPLIGFFVVAPLFFLINHFYLMLTLLSLGRRIREYNQALREEHLARECEDGLRRKLDSFVIVLALAGTEEEQSGRTGMLLRAITWLTVVAAPVLLLLFIQLTFLPYHFALVTWLHRVVLIGDLVLLWVFWPATRVGHTMLPVPPVGAKPVTATAAAFCVIFSVFIATFPGELADKTGIGGDLKTTTKHMTSSTPKDWVLWPLKQWLFEGEVELVSGRRKSLLSRTLVLPDQDFVVDERLDEIKARAIKEGKTAATSERTFAERGRDFRGAVLTRADLRHADLTGANFEGAELINARLQGVNLESASLQGANLYGASLLGANLEKASLHDAYLVGANLRGGRLVFANLQGAELDNASLQDADMDSANLQGASLRNANLQGVDLSGASLQDVDLFDASLLGADLSRANLQGASLLDARLHGANLKRASLQGADFGRTSLLGADLSSANLQGADVIGAWLQGTDLQLAKIGRTFAPSSSNLQHADLRFLNVRAPNDTDVMALNNMLKNIEDDAVRQRVAESVKPVLDAKTWEGSAELQGWKVLLSRPRSAPAEVSAFLAKLACDDGKDGYVAKGIANRVRRNYRRPYSKQLVKALLKDDCEGAKVLDDETRSKLRELAEGGTRP